MKRAKKPYSMIFQKIWFSTKPKLRKTTQRQESDDQVPKNTPNLSQKEISQITAIISNLAEKVSLHSRRCYINFKVCDKGTLLDTNSF